MNSILLVNYEYPPIGAGAANATCHTAQAMVSLGFHPVVVTAAFGKNRGIAEDKGVTVIRIPALRRYANKSGFIEMATYMASLTLNLRRIFKRYKIHHAIIYFSFPCGPIGLLLRLFFKTRYIVSLRGGDVPGTEPRLRLMYWLLTPLRRLVFSHSEAVIANSRGLAELSMKTDAHPVHVVSNGVDTEFWRPAGGKGDKGTFDILFVGRFHQQKNLPFLIKEFAVFHQSNPNAHMTLVGDGPELSSLTQQALVNGISENVTWYGWATPHELKELYTSADCLVNPSNYEGMPNVLLEAFACGLPVIASDIIGNNELVEHGETGLLFEAGNSAEFQSSLISMRDGGQEVEKMIRNAREKVINSHTWIAVCQQYLDYFPGRQSTESGGSNR